MMFYDDTMSDDHVRFTLLITLERLISYSNLNFLRYLGSYH